jgi:hypothetical protein
VELPVVDDAGAVLTGRQHVGEARARHDVVERVLLADVDHLADRLVEPGQPQIDLGLLRA